MHAMEPCRRASALLRAHRQVVQVRPAGGLCARLCHWHSPNKLLSTACGVKYRLCLAGNAPCAGDHAQPLLFQVEMFRQAPTAYARMKLCFRKTQLPATATDFFSKPSIR
eukprot:363424-Chlamydomonas_euryale.AAC.8